MIKITAKPIDVQKVIDTASSLSAGAVNVYVGTVQDVAHHKNLRWVEYEALEAVAIAEIRMIVDEAAHRWRLQGWAIGHRVGTLKPGEVAMVVAVSSANRRDSFEACEFIVDAIKAKVPIWKKEVFERGDACVSAIPAMVMSVN